MAFFLHVFRISVWIVVIVFSCLNKAHDGRGSLVGSIADGKQAFLRLSAIGWSVVDQYLPARQMAC